jgi:hypothetical protein
MIRVSSSEEFSRLLDALANDVVYANIHWKQAEGVSAALDEHPQVWAQSRTFWHLTLNANRYTALQALARAYDQNQSSLHLLSLLRTIQVNAPLFSEPEFRKRLAGNPFVDSLAADPRTPDPAILEQDIALCSAKDPDVHALLMYRSNLLAHRNAKTTAAGTASDGQFAVPGTTVRTLLDRSRTVLNRYSYLFAAATHSVNMIGHDDYRYIFKAVQAAVDRFPGGG